MRIEDFLNQNSIIAGRIGQSQTSVEPKPDQAGEKANFADVLSQTLATNELTFSKHARQRLAQRSIDLSAGDLQRLGDAVKKAEQKGADNTLVLSDKGAFIVNISNNTVITAMDNNDLKENIFTQIDSAVII